MYDYNKAIQFRAGSGYSCTRNINEGTLRRYALLALADRNMLSPRMVTEEDLIAHKKGENKTFTLMVYGDDIHGRYGNQVMFANSEDVHKLMSFMENVVGPKTMEKFERHINGDPDDVEVIASSYYKKWKTSDEDWPLAC